VANEPTPTPPQSCPTPDFYVYEWAALESADPCGDGVIVRWRDGTELRCHPLWLRENLIGDPLAGLDGIDPVTRETTVDLARLPADLRLIDVGVKGGALAVAFEPEGLQATYHPGWLRHVAEGRHQPASHLPDAVAWTTTDLAEPPTHDGSAVLDDDEVLRRWLHDLVAFGVARLENTPADPRHLEAVVARIGELRGSNFGRIWHVDVDVDPVSTANTSLRLPAHTDLPTRETPPGFQYLHCIENDVDGGASTMTDGLAVAEHLRATEPDALEALRTLEWVFFNRAQDHDHRWTGPFVDDGDGRIPYTFRAFHPVRAFPAMDPNEVGRGYAALRTFAEVANSERFQMRYPFRVGDIVAFDNRRVLHGRDSFDVGSGGRRRLHGTYMDTDEVYSRLRVLARRADAPHERAADPVATNPVSNRIEESNV